MTSLKGAYTNSVKLNVDSHVHENAMSIKLFPTISRYNNCSYQYKGSIKLTLCLVCCLVYNIELFRENVILDT